MTSKQGRCFSGYSRRLSVFHNKNGINSVYIRIYLYKFATAISQYYYKKITGYDKEYGDYRTRSCFLNKVDYLPIQKCKLCFISISLQSIYYYHAV